MLTSEEVREIELRVAADYACLDAPGFRDGLAARRDVAALLEDRAELVAEIERLRAVVENHGTFRRMDMTPNDDLPRRILSAYLDYSEWTDNTDGLEPTNPLILAMNQHRAQRNALIEAALAALEARDE